MFLVLFLSTTYCLNRPCVYCSLLLAILIAALFDFNTDWFAPPQTALSLPAVTNSSVEETKLSDVVGESAALLTGALDGTVKSLLRGTTTRGSSQMAQTGHDWSGFGLSWLREAVNSGELRIDCLNAAVRL